MKLPEKIKEDYECGRISVHEYESKVFRFNKRQEFLEERAKEKQKNVMLRKRRIERDIENTRNTNEYLKYLEDECKRLGLNRKYKRREIATDVVQLVYEENIKKYGKLMCYLCNEPVKFGNDAVDHKIPVSRGGINDFDNLGITHSRCNSIKNSKTVEEYENYRDKNKE